MTSRRPLNKNYMTGRMAYRMFFLDLWTFYGYKHKQTENNGNSRKIDIYNSICRPI